jgi:hypothetical protein
MIRRLEYPLPLPEKRGLSRIEAAQYVGVSAGLFDAMVADGRMPPPKPVNARLIWDRRQLDEAFEALPHKDGAPGDTRQEAWSDVSV